MAIDLPGVLHAWISHPKKIPHRVSGVSLPTDQAPKAATESALHHQPPEASQAEFRPAICQNPPAEPEPREGASPESPWRKPGVYPIATIPEPEAKRGRLTLHNTLSTEPPPPNPKTPLPVLPKNLPPSSPRPAPPPKPATARNSPPSPAANPRSPPEPATSPPKPHGDQATRGRATRTSRHEGIPKRNDESLV
jgi:hypothetical protein